MERRNPNMGCPYFFKPIIPTRNCQRLDIPVPFLDHIIHENSRSFFLTGPSGNVWSVMLVKNTDEHYFFEQGWPVFVRDHFLKFGDICVFKYKGNSNFKVLILDTRGGQKESAFQAICTQDCTRSKKDKGKKIVRNEAENELNAYSNELHPCRSNRNGKRPANPIQAKLKTGTIISSRREATEEEKERALNAAKAFQSNNRLTVMVMKPSYVYSGHNLPIPASFRTYLPEVERTMILKDPKGKDWDVKYVTTTETDKYTRGWLSGGWSAFSFGNNIEADDVCIFELIRENEMQVHIFRAVEEITPLRKHSIRKKRGSARLSLI